MKRFAIAIGLLLPLLSPVSAHAQQEPEGLRLYEKMHAITEQEIALKGVDDQIVTYVARLAEQEDMIPEGKNVMDMPEVVKAALETRLDDFCEMYNATFDGCPQVYQMFRDWALDIIETRTLSTDLLHIATGYETGVNGNMGEIFTIAEHTLTIRNLWRSRDDALLTSEVFPLIRAVPRPASITDSMFDTLGSELKKHAPNAIWRYRYGMTAFDREPCRETGGDTELFETSEERACIVEQKLRALRDALPSSALNFDPPLQRGEIAIFPLRKLDDPPHVIVWMMAENVNGTIVRDAGVGWDLMLDPVPIGILRRTPEIPCDANELSEAYCTVVERFMVRPGGRYEDPPGEPGEDEGICHLAFARDGYLCRPLRHDRCNAELENKEPRSIVLAECQPAQALEPVALTESGPDICRTGWWRTPSIAQGNPACSPCTVDIQCEDTCAGGAPGLTLPKDENGKIHICLSNNNLLRAELSANLLHELVHAQQMCSLPPHTLLSDTAERCCAREVEAYAVSCRVYAEDGILDEIGISQEECRGGAANVSCRKFGEHACSSLAAEDVQQKIKKALERRGRASGPTLPSCQDLVKNGTATGTFDTRPLSMIEGLNGACSPGCPTKYENTIGNNLCYVGQCIEQSIEQSRVIPGRMALGTEDESFPWDACAAENTQAAGMIALPALSPPLTPSYNPRLLVESLDRALCQLNGLPALTPPIRCQFDYQRRLSNPTSDYVSTTLSFTAQIGENEEPTASLQRMTQGIATRIGTSLLTRYLAWAGRALSDTLRAGNELIETLAKTQFPLQTCPRNATEQPDFCNASQSPPK